MLGVHPTAAEIGNLIMQITVFGGAATKDFVIAQRVLLIDGQGFPLFDLLGQDGIGFQSESVCREVGKVVGKENIQISVPLFGVGGGQAINQVDANVFKTN